MNNDIPVIQIPVPWVSLRVIPTRVPYPHSVVEDLVNGHDICSTSLRFQGKIPRISSLCEPFLAIEARKR